MNNLDPLSRRTIIASLARLQPAAVVRLGTTSRAMQANTANKKRQLDALKRLVRRRVARIRHFESPRQPGRPRGRLRSPLHEAKIRAAAFRYMSELTRRAAKRHDMYMSAARAYFNYERSGTQANWNRFVRIHAKRPGWFNTSITRQQARNMYHI